MWECQDCFRRGELDIHGNCPGCGSAAVSEMARWPTDKQISDGNIAELNRIHRAIVPDWEEAEDDE